MGQKILKVCLGEAGLEVGTLWFESAAGREHSSFQRVSFSILVSNVDDHLKNHGFLYSGNGKWRLSPAFDVNPAAVSRTQDSYR
ncbi:HipA domain-containing protein [Verminephrobacter aporrectodeae]|uniref:HipA domain-containing protein n=1 Tax=Verminephrobacter aporrectodeae TaxID=1110389 RepID=UPI002238B240|nr:HipA domain-containing protein [Verminephrobacter aporrectodeae]